MGRATARPIATLSRTPSSSNPYTQLMELAELIAEHERFGAIVHLATVVAYRDPQWERRVPQVFPGGVPGNSAVRVGPIERQTPTA
jgi:hypothetical protein